MIFCMIGFDSTLLKTKQKSDSVLQAKQKIKQNQDFESLHLLLRDEESQSRVFFKKKSHFY